MKRSLKRAVSLLLCAVLLVGVMGSTALAASKTSGKCGKNVKWSYNSKTKTLTISGKGKMHNYYRGEPVPWADYSSKTKKIVVKKGVTRIGGYAFADFTRLKEVSLPSSLTVLDAGCFAFCTNLRFIKIPKGVKKIRPTAFLECYNLRSITIPKSVRLIDECAFCECKKLEKVSLSEGLKTIEFEAFYGCPKLKKITIPKSVTRIGDGAFGAESTYYDEYSDRLVHYYDKDFCICGQNNTAAERYAKENGIKFKTA